MKGRNFGRIAMTGLGLVLLSTPAFAQESGGLNLIDMFESMGPVAIAVAVVLFIMSFWSVGVAIERIYTYSQARKQSKLYAPQVAKHLKDGRLKEAIGEFLQRHPLVSSVRPATPEEGGGGVTIAELKD